MSRLQRDEVLEVSFWSRDHRVRLRLERKSARLHTLDHSLDRGTSRGWVSHDSALADGVATDLELWLDQRDHTPTIAQDRFGGGQQLTQADKRCVDHDPIHLLR